MYTQNMTENEICERIYELVVPHIARIDAPIAYVNMEIPVDSTLSRKELKDAFEKVCFDTELATADLFIDKKERGGFHDSESVRVLSITGFEDEKGLALVATIENGEIF